MRTSVFLRNFDAEGRIVRVLDPIKRAIETQYDRRGLKATITYDSGRTQSNAYDSDSRNTGIRNVIAGNDVQRFTYTFDANGNRIGTVDLNGSVTTYTLDANDRLTEDLTVGTEAHTFTYTYDSRGNLLTTSEAGVVAAHGCASPRLCSRQMIRRSITVLFAAATTT